MASLKIDRRLFYRMPVRLAKKCIGNRAAKLNYAVNLKPGDLISTCKGFNEKIVEITPCWTNYGLRRGWYVYDFDVVTESGSCSVAHCCSFPLETREEIYESWKYWLAVPDEQGWGFKKYAQRIEEVRAAGEHAFDENGQPYYEFCLHDGEREVRFPERWKQENAK